MLKNGKELDMSANDAKSDLELMVGNGERIFWKGRPNKKCYILEGIFNPLLPFALIWFLFDAFFIGTMVYAHNNSAEMPPLILMLCFFALHLMPVWIYLAGVFFVFRRYRHTEYIVTDKGVYVSGGVFAYTCEMKLYIEVSRVNIHRGLFDQYLKVGDVVLSGSNDMGLGRVHLSMSGFRFSGGLTIADIPNYQEVFNLIKKLQADVYSDTMYPNNLRPKENNGYQTEYKGM